MPDYGNIAAVKKLQKVQFSAAEFLIKSIHRVSLLISARDEDVLVRGLGAARLSRRRRAAAIQGQKYK